MKAEKFFMAAFGCLLLALGCLVIFFASYRIWADMQDRVTCEQHEGIYTRDGCFILGVPRLP